MLEGLRKPTELIVIVVTLLAYGCPLQAIVKAFGLDERTVASWCDWVGKQCQRVQQAVIQQGQLPLTHVQADMHPGQRKSTQAVLIPSALPSGSWLIYGQKARYEMPSGLWYNDKKQQEMPCVQPTKHTRRLGTLSCSQCFETYRENFFLQGMARLKLENPALLAQHAQDYLHHLAAEMKGNSPFACDVVVVLGGNIVKSGVGYITTSYSKATKKSFGAQGRVITAAFLYHQGVCDCIILSTGKTDPEDQGAPTEAAVMKAELMTYGVPETCIYLEEGSRTTEENARELAKLLSAESFKEKKTIGVVTSSWHIRRTDAFLTREGVKREGRTIKYISSDTMLCRYLPEFREDMYMLYRRQEMKERIRDEHNGYNALKNGIYQSRTIGEIAVEK